METNRRSRSDILASSPSGNTVFARDDDRARQRGGAWDQPEIVHYRRMLDSVTRLMPDGRPVQFWVFEDPSTPRVNGHPAASPIIRIQEHQRAHIRLETCSRTRFGASANGDAAGLSDAATECFTYQWQPSTSGTWFYQSHASRPVDFEMGLYGVTVVEPSRAPHEPARAYARGPVYDVERILVFDDVDPNWHCEPEHAHDAENRFQSFNPKYFLINDVPNTQVRDHPNVAVDAVRGQNVLLRLMNASFSVVTVSIAGLKSHIISVDGHPVAAADRPWSRWIPVEGGQGVFLATASRHDLLINLERAEPGDYEVIIEFQDNKRRVHNANASHPAYVGRAVTTIRVK